MWFTQRKDEHLDQRWTEWYSYLRLAFRVEPVGQRYLRTLVLRLKFELNASLALVIAGCGLPFTHIQFISPYLLGAVMLAVACYLSLIRSSRLCGSPS